MGVFFIVLGFIAVVYCLHHAIESTKWLILMLVLSAVFVAGGIELCIHGMV